MHPTIRKTLSTSFALIALFLLAPVAGASTVQQNVTNPDAEGYVCLRTLATQQPGETVTAAECPSPADVTTYSELVDLLEGVYIATYNDSVGKLSAGDQATLSVYDPVFNHSITELGIALRTDLPAFADPVELQDFVDALDRGGFLMELEAYEQVLNDPDASTSTVAQAKDSTDDSIDAVIKALKDSIDGLPDWLKSVLCALVEVLKEILEIVAK